MQTGRQGDRGCKQADRVIEGENMQTDKQTDRVVEDANRQTG